MYLPTYVITQNGRTKVDLCRPMSRLSMNGSEEFGYICMFKHLFWLEFVYYMYSLLIMGYTYMYISLSLSPASYKRRSKQKKTKNKKKREKFSNKPNHDVPSPSPTLITSQQPIIFPAPVSILILYLLSLLLADSAHYDQISNYLLSPHQDCGDSLLCGSARHMGYAWGLAQQDPK